MEKTCPTFAGVKGFIQALRVKCPGGAALTESGPEGSAPAAGDLAVQSTAFMDSAMRMRWSLGSISRSTTPENARVASAAQT